ncbi:MAG: hypothetical protein JNJ62_07755 [Pseudoxanthomonas mexicana]|nr:hypothetical protein [Pseudoxanthomonas mexicana]
MPRFPALLSALLAVALALLPSAAYAQDGAKDVKVLVVFPQTPTPSKVYFATDGEFTRGLLIPFAAIANSANLRKRSDTLGAQLDATLVGYDRYAVLEEALRKSFGQRSPMFMIEATTDVDRFLPGEKLGTAAAQAGYRYVITIEEVFSGLSMLNLMATRSDDVAPMATIRYRVYETSDRRQLLKGVAAQNGMTKKHIDHAPGDRALFVDAYPQMAQGIATQLVGNLFRTDTLHAMAASIGRGGEVPKVSAVLKQNERRFAYTFKPAEGWKQTKMNTRYASVLEPRTDLRYRMGMRFEIDLLVPEFGQAVDNLDDYLPPFLERLGDTGVDMTTFAPFDDIQAPGYRIYSHAVGDKGGRNVVMMRMLDKDMLEVVTIVVLEDFDALYPQYRAALEQNLSATRLKVANAR